MSLMKNWGDHINVVQNICQVVRDMAITSLAIYSEHAVYFIAFIHSD